MKLKKNDKVKIVGGKDKGKEGIIERAYPLQDKVLIPGINVYKKHIKKNRTKSSRRSCSFTKSIKCRKYSIDLS
jgi:ribosomal protein L24